MTLMSWINESKMAINCINTNIMAYVSESSHANVLYMYFDRSSFLYPSHAVLDVTDSSELLLFIWHHLQSML